MLQSHLNSRKAVPKEAPKPFCGCFFLEMDWDIFGYLVAVTGLCDNYWSTWLLRGLRGVHSMVSATYIPYTKSHEHPVIAT